GSFPVTANSVQCVDPEAHCVAIWTVRENKSEVLLQGCWNVVQDACSGPDICSSGNRIFQSSRSGYPTYMCCCRPSNCNHINRIVVGPLYRQRSNETHENSREDHQEKDSRMTILVWISSMLSVAILLLAAKRYYRTRRQGQSETAEVLRRLSASGVAPVPWSAKAIPSQSDTSVEEPLLEDHDPFVASLQLLERIGSGHFADVFRASSNLGDVAVKVYHADQATFDNEFDNLTLLQSLKHPNTVQLIRADVATKGLVLQLYSGSLHSLLEEHSLDMTDFFDCAIAISGVPKPVIAHRDLNPHNVLYSRQGGARIQLCIADFGLSVSFPEGRPAKSLELLTERGTVRYMAVELLEGSVNLLDPMTSLLQTDVYSCALVLWELFWRCRDVWPAGEIPSHRVAYDNLVPRNPRLEHMYQVVVRERRRPDIPPANSKAESLVELWSSITEMWEQEPEGRTTAACSADRLRRLRRSLDPTGAERDQ
ncbi:hypothetical protein COOONC_04777, partial [Cooperia oncophora]